MKGFSFQVFPEKEPPLRAHIYFYHHQPPKSSNPKTQRVISSNLRRTPFGSNAIRSFPHLEPGFLQISPYERAPVGLHFSGTLLSPIHLVSRPLHLAPPLPLGVRRVGHFHLSCCSTTIHGECIWNGHAKLTMFGRFRIISQVRLSRPSAWR
ncbi:hypothetical protein VTK73DRAFT_1452 [Phialemonium thermophilum]|uniref:Uncharacterized protein n=1 Tax=Phialemonium thermophilum TaxID=223376 RepID=A0ABR3VTE1_9PEZI